MQHIYCFLKLGHIEDSIGSAFVSDSDFLHSTADRRHRLPIIRLFSLLDLEELKPGCFLDALWKPAKIFPR